MNITIEDLEGYLSDRYSGRATELADMLHYIVAIAAINEIDLSRIILEKDKVASVKYHHEINLERYIHSRGNTDSE